MKNEKTVASILNRQIETIELDRGKLMDESEETKMRAIEEIFCSVEDDFEAGQLIDVIAGYFINVSDACGHDEPMYDEIADKLITIKKMLSR